MHIVFETADRRYEEFDLEIAHPEASVADLVDRLGGARAEAGLLIGDRLVPPDVSLVEAGLYEGVTVRFPTAPAPAPAEPAPVALHVIGGIDAGASVPLVTGSTSVGRGRHSGVVLDHPTVSTEHCEFQVTTSREVSVRDRGSRNGTWIDGQRLPKDEWRRLALGSIVEIGAVLVRPDQRRTDDRPMGLHPHRDAGAAGTVLFNRPPRSISALEDAPLDVPEPPEDTEKARFSVIQVVTPLLLAGAMAYVRDSWEFALFGLLSPLMVISNWFEASRRGKSRQSKESKRFAAELTDFERRVGVARGREIQHRLTTFPDVAEVLRRASLPSVRLWERRAGDPDFLQLSAGLGDMPWRPTLERHKPPLPDAVTAVLEENCTLPLVSATVGLGEGGVVGIVGDRRGALALARSLVAQAAVFHGPADLTMGVFVDPEHKGEWDWTKWLPHTRDLNGRVGARWLSSSHEDSQTMLSSLSKGRSIPGVLLLVIDSERLTQGRRAPARAALSGEGGPAGGIVIASSEDRLPAVVDTVIELQTEDGDARLHRPRAGTEIESFLIAGLSEPAARRCARSLARFEDPELDLPGGGLPERVNLLPLLATELEVDAIQERWRRNRDLLEAPLGVSEHGVFRLDLVRDGPHGLIAGTTGAGKSELLRSLIAGLALSADPNHLNFVLVDYKGGAAFDKCAELPHTVGMVTDLDEQLAERALRSLEAELHHRERLLRAAGVSDLPSYLALGLDDPLPRLVVVMDEFATLKEDLQDSDFVGALVGIAQRGRSLGVHMILATQRPSGAVNDDIRANTNLRIALRVQDANDSTEVIGTKDAASLSRSQPGRAYVRLGPGEIVPIQTALVTAVTEGGETRSVNLASFEFGPMTIIGVGPSIGATERDERPTDLALLVDGARGAFARGSYRSPRRPWREPLSRDIDLAEIMSTSQTTSPTLVPFVMADDPDAQSQYPAGWDLSTGNLILYGIGGSGTTTALGSLAVAAASRFSADQLHLYVMDFGAGELGALQQLANIGAVVGAVDRERQMRLVRLLRVELNRRRERGGASPSDPRIVLLVDNAAAFFAEFNDMIGMEVLEEFGRIYADGSEVGINVVLTSDRVGGVPSALANVTANRWVLHLADTGDYSAFGLKRKEVPSPAPGRAVIASSKQVVQIGRPSPSLQETAAKVAATAPPAEAPPTPVAILPASVPLASVVDLGDLSGIPWTIPVGISDEDLQPIGLTFYEGDHALIAGPPRSGKTSTLWAVAETIKRMRPEVRVLGLFGPRSPLGRCSQIEPVARPAELAGEVAASRGLPVVVMVDDADMLDEIGDAMAGVLAQKQPDFHVIISGRSDALRSLYGHWTQTIRKSKLGILLKPNIDSDWELFGCNLPRRERVPFVAGRGYLVNDGEVKLVQVAVPEEVTLRHS